MNPPSAERCLERSQLQLYASGELIGSAADQCEAHLQACSNCQALLVECFECSRGQQTHAVAMQLNAMQLDTMQASDAVRATGGLALWRSVANSPPPVSAQPDADRAVLQPVNAQPLNAPSFSAQSFNVRSENVQALNAAGIMSAGAVSRQLTGQDSAEVSTWRDSSLGARPYGEALVTDDSWSMPETVGRYRRLSLLGNGGFGRVYLAFDEQLKRRVALKVPHAAVIENSARIEMLLAEAQTVASLDHPAIAPIYDVGSCPSVPMYLVTKLIEGQNLAQRMATGIVSLAEALQWTMHVAEALHYAHTQDVVHRDVKPHNILLDLQGKVYVTDFGLAWRKSNSPIKHPRAGTPAYMSPEQSGQVAEPIDHRSDIYSLGRILIELVAISFHNQNTFAETADVVQPNSHLDVNTCTEAWRELVPVDIQAIFKKATEWNPNDRYQTAAAFGGDLRAVMQAHGLADGLTDQALTAAAPGRLAMPPRLTTKSWVALGLTAVVLVIGCWGWRIWDQQQHIKSVVTSLLSCPPDSINLHARTATSCGPSIWPRLAQLAESTDQPQSLRAKVALLQVDIRYLPDVLKAMLDGNAAMADALGDALLPHAELIAPELWAVADSDWSTKKCHRLNAVMFLAKAFKDDARWSNEEFREKLATCLVQDELEDLSIRAEAMVNVKHHVIESFKALQKPRSMAVVGTARLMVYDVWNVFVKDDLRATLELLMESPPAIYEKIVDRMKPDEVTIKMLRDHYQALEDGLLNNAALTNHQQYVTALALLRLGCEEDYWKVWTHSPRADRGDNSMTTLGFLNATRRYIYEVWVKRKYNEPLKVVCDNWKDRVFGDLSRRRLIVQALTRTVDANDLSPKQSDDLVDSLQLLAVLDADSGMRAMAEWYLKFTGKNGPEYELPRPPTGPQDHPNWSVNSLGQIEVHILDAPQPAHAFAIAQYEVQQTDFELFLRETNYSWSMLPREQRGQPGFPQSMVSWYDCAAFCNWLSRREGLDECYECNATGQYADGMRIKPNAIALNGYRLPLQEEWKTASAAGAATLYSSGNSSVTLLRYAWTGQNSNGVLQASGQLRPNQLGLSDTSGNLREWILDTEDQNQMWFLVQDAHEREHRGGDYAAHDVSEFAIEHSAKVYPGLRLPTIGFRVARTLKRP